MLGITLQGMCRITVLMIVFFLPITVNAEETLKLTLKDCIDLALKNNLDIKVETYNPLSLENDIEGARGDFDPGLSFSGNYLNSRFKVFNNRGIPGTSEGDESFFNVKLSVGQHLITGTNYQVELQSSVSDSNALFRTLDNSFESESSDTYYQSSVTFGLSQSLLKGFGIGINRTRITLAEHAQANALEQLTIRVTEIVLNVEQAYWNLALTQGNLEVEKRSLELAKQTQRNIEAQVQVGLLAPIEVLVAKAEVALRESQLISAEQALRDAQDLVKKYLNTKDGSISDEIIQTNDNPMLSEQPLPPPLEESIQTAMANRPEIRQLELNLKSQQVALQTANNAKLPDLSLQGSFTLSGLSVKQEEQSSDEETDESAEEEISIDDSYFDTFKQYDDNYQYSAGIVLSYPLGNRAAKANAKNASLSLEKTKLTERNLKQAIVLEIRQALRGVESILKQIEASRIAKELAQEKLSAEEKKLKVGTSTFYNVLKFQQDFATAERNHLQAVIAYRIALAKLAKAKGALLDQHKIDISPFNHS